MPRVFVAAEVPVEGLRARGLFGTGSAPAHVTLAFLGEVEAARLPSVREALTTALDGEPAFRVGLRGVGAFPNPRRPRVVWVGFAEGTDAFVRLAARVARALDTVGVPSEPRPFVPHVTLLRVRGPRDAARAREILDRFGAESFDAGVVDELLLKESELGPGGARHTTLARFPLASRDDTAPV